MTEDKKTILIVEDEPALLKVYSDGLTEEGFHIVRARNGQEGMEVALREKPALILLDILMPVMDGLTMMKKLREDHLWGKEVPIILLTNLSSSEEEIMKAITKYEPAYYLVKSDYTLQGVVEKIQERLARKV